MLCTPPADWGRSHRSSPQHGWPSLSFPDWHLQASQGVPSCGKARKRGYTENWSGTGHPREGACLHLCSCPVNNHHGGCKEARARGKSRVSPDVTAWSAPDFQTLLGPFPSVQTALCLAPESFRLVLPDGLWMNYPLLSHVQGTLEICLNTSPVIMVHVLAN